MTLSVPEGCTVVSTGSEAQSADGTWTLKADKVRDFAVIVGESFEKLTARAGDVTVNSYYNSAADGDKSRARSHSRPQLTRFPPLKKPGANTLTIRSTSFRRRITTAEWNTPAWCA